MRVVPLLLTGCGWFAAPDDGRPDLLFARDVDGVTQVWAVDADGGDLRPFVAVDGGVWPGDGHPGGTAWLLVVSAEGGGLQLATVPAVGGDLTRLTDPTAVIRTPVWVKGGAAIAYTADHDSFRDLYEVPIGGGPRVRRTEGEGGAFEPSPGPDGAIAIGSSRAGNAEIHVLAADGTLTRLTDDPADDMTPAWQPGGDRVAFLSSRGGMAQVWTVPATGGEPTLLGPAEGYATSTVWSPDGTRLAMTVRRDAHDLDVVIVTPEGDVVAELGGPGVDEHPAWSPDGTRIVWSRADDGDPDLWIANADGTGARVLVDTPDPDWLPRWRADAR